MYKPLLDWINDPTKHSDPGSMLIDPTQPDQRSQGCGGKNGAFGDGCDTSGNGGVDSYYMLDIRNPGAGISCKTRWLADTESSYYQTAAGWDWLAYSYHLATKANIQDVCGADLYDTVWPHFYHFYNNSVGKAQIDHFISDSAKNGQVVPDACQKLLKTNYTDVVQQKYGLLNGWDLTVDHLNQNYNHWWSFDGTLKPLAQLQQDLRRQTLAETDFTNPNIVYGDPTWDHNQRQEMFRLVMGKDYKGKNGNGQDFIDEWADSYLGQGFINPGKDADDYFNPEDAPGQKNWTTDPDYAGELPYLPSYNAVVTGDWHRDTSDPTYSKFTTACENNDLIGELLPTAAGIVGGVLGAAIIPGQTAKFMAAITLGGSAYMFASGTLGMAALLAWGGDANTLKKDNASYLLSVGAPITILQCAFDIGIVPAKLLEGGQGIYFGSLAAAGLVGYVVIYPIVEPILDYGGDVLTGTTAVLDVLGDLVGFFATGCADHRNNGSNVCMCENANAKPPMSAAIVEDMYGTTGKQAAMRLECMHAATTTGSWGTDPYHMGSCSSNGWMTPTACVSAPEWAYQKWDPAINNQAAPMYAEISHCIDINNPSFLPPLDADAPCVLKHGKHARMGAITTAGVTRPGEAGKCYDFQAPAGQQSLETNPYNWGTLDAQTTGCTIL